MDRTSPTRSSQQTGAARPPTLSQSAVVEAAFVVIALAIIAVSGRPLPEALLVLHLAPIVEIGLGLVLGVALASLAAVAILNSSLRARVRPFLRNFSGVRPTVANLIVLGMLAGVGEETLFRSALQPLIGIFLASLLFTLAHAPIAQLQRPSLG
jgi:uncharacterized protein